MPDGRLCIRGMQGRAHIFIVITFTMTPAFGLCLTDQESFAKYMVLWISAHFQTKQSPWTTQYHKEQMFWHLFLSHYMCWLGPHNNIIIMIRIWYLVRENDDDDEEDDCGGACLVLANRTCLRTGLHFTFSLRLHTGPSLNITYHWLRKTVWLVGNDQLFHWDSCLKNSLLHCLRKMQNATKVFVKTVRENHLSKIVWGIVWKLLETRLRGNALCKACHQLFPMNKIDTMTNVSRIKLRRISMGNF